MDMLEGTEVLRYYGTAITTAVATKKNKIREKRAINFFLNFLQMAHRKNSPGTKFELRHHVR